MLYPEIGARVAGHLAVAPRHRIYFEECGRPDGLPVLFFHGGPGSNVSPVHRRFFDPRVYRIILFDQRGCGKSTPSASVDENTTWDLVADVERLLDHLDVGKALLFGGSWGSTLALAFATSFPERVRGLILRGLFLVSPRELKWLYQDGASRLFPEEFALYRSAVPEAQWEDLIGAFHRLIHEGTMEQRLDAARAWCRWEAATSFIVPRVDYQKKFEDDGLTLAFAAIESHYFAHGGFFSNPDELLDRLPRIRHLPATIVQGRYDLVCPMETAWRVHLAWPEARLEVVPLGGHSALDEAITRALLAATDDFARTHGSHN